MRVAKATDGNVVADRRGHRQETNRRENEEGGGDKVCARVRKMRHE